MHHEVTNDVTRVGPCLFNPMTSKDDLRVSGYIEEIGATQVVVAFRYSCIYAGDIDFYRNRRSFRMIAVDLDPALELREFTMSRANKLVGRESDC
jgi:hypothetical protein